MMCNTEGNSGRNPKAQLAWGKVASTLTFAPDLQMDAERIDESFFVTGSRPVSHDISSPLGDTGVNPHSDKSSISTPWHGIYPQHDISSFGFHRRNSSIYFETLDGFVICRRAFWSSLCHHGHARLAEPGRV